MNLLRHWIVRHHGDPPRVVKTEQDAELYRRNGGHWHVEGPYVLEAQLAGAVEDLMRITELAQAAVRDCREPDKVLAYAHEIAILAAGGQ